MTTLTTRSLFLFTWTFFGLSNFKLKSCSTLSDRRHRFCHRLCTHEAEYPSSKKWKIALCNRYVSLLFLMFINIPDAIYKLDALKLTFNRWFFPRFCFPMNFNWNIFPLDSMMRFFARTWTSKNSRNHQRNQFTRKQNKFNTAVDGFFSYRAN